MSQDGPHTQTTNGLIRCYNMVPDNFNDINEMTSHLGYLKELGINVVWINPVQLAGDTVIEKADALTGQTQTIKSCIYAMKDTTFIDPRFSVVKRDAEGDMLLSPIQAQSIREHEPRKLLKRIKTSRERLATLAEMIASDERKISAITTAQKRKKGKGIEFELIQSDLSDLKAKLENNKKKQTRLEKTFQQDLTQQMRCISQLDTQAMRAFTQAAKDLGIAPIFDLVLNHIAIDAPTVKETPEWFDPRDRTYRDAMAFKYGKLNGKYAEQLSEKQQKELLTQIPEVVKRFWHPFINTYINTYQFSGARVDCVRKVPQLVRQQVYDLIRQGVEAQQTSTPCIILEETLFSDLSPEAFADKVKGAGATHNTGSVYYRSRQWHGGLENDYSSEDYYKKSMVQNGVVNFSGNHDHYTCAMTVCRELAFERLQENTELYASYKDFIAKKEQQNYEKQRAQGIAESEQKGLSDPVIEQIKSQYIHHYVAEIIAELNNPDEFNDKINRFGIQFRDKLLTSALAGSGGYFMLSGDEFASLHQPSIFLRDNNGRVYPQNELAVFNGDHATIAENILVNMAIENILPKKYGPTYAALSPENKVIFLSAIKEQLRNEINAGVTNTKNAFIRHLKRSLKKDFNKALLNEVPKPSHLRNHWRAPSSLARFVDISFFQELNHILEQLPTSNNGYWAELFKAQNNNLLIAVRVNGTGYTTPTDIVLYNLNPDEPIQLELQELQKIGMWLQKRGYPNILVDQGLPDDYHRAYGCVMGSAEYHQAPANLYFAGKFHPISSSVEEYTVSIAGRDARFNIVVAPKSLQQDPLLPSVKEIVPDSVQDILDIFKGLMLSQSSSSNDDDRFEGMVANGSSSLIFSSSSKSESSCSDDYSPDSINASESSSYESGSDPNYDSDESESSFDDDILADPAFSNSIRFYS